MPRRNKGDAEEKAMAEYADFCDFIQQDSDWATGAQALIEGGLGVLMPQAAFCHIAKRQLPTHTEETILSRCW